MDTKPHELAFDHMDEDALVKIIHELRDQGALDGAADGIGNQIEIRGRATLTAKQRWAFLLNGFIENTSVECDRCCAPIPPEEMVWSKSWASGRCSGCQHSWEKLQDE